MYEKQGGHVKRNKQIQFDIFIDFADILNSYIDFAYPPFSSALFMISITISYIGYKCIFLAYPYKMHIQNCTACYHLWI